MTTEEQEPQDLLQPMLIDAERVAFLLGISTGTFWRLNSCERAPRPIKLGRRTLWRVDEIREWVAAGCPARERWEFRTKGTWDQSASPRAPRSKRPSV